MAATSWGWASTARSAAVTSSTEVPTGRRSGTSALPALADGEYYHHDLIGLPCVSTDGSGVGDVVAVENFGAGDILEIRRPDGKRFMVPMNARAVPAWSNEGVTIDAAFVD